MKKILMMAAMLSVSYAAMAATAMANIWAEVEAYPTGAGKVYMTSDDAKPFYESGWGDRSDSKFTIVTSGDSFYYTVKNGDFVQYSIPRFMGTVEVEADEDYDCVGLVKTIREDGNYANDDYYEGGVPTYDRSPTVTRSTNEYGKRITFVEKATAVDMNSGREGAKYAAQTVIDGDENDKARTEMSAEDYYWFVHNATVEKGTWPSEPTKIYALFEKKVTVDMDKSGQMIFSSAANLKIQKGSGLQAYVVYKVEDGIGKLKATDSIPANMGVVLKGEPGKTYKLDRIPEPKVLVIGNAEGTKRYNALLCEIYGFYPESEILYRFGNYDYGTGFYKSEGLSQADGDYLTMAIAGGVAPSFFTIEGFTTGIGQVAVQTDAQAEGMFDLQGRRLAEEPQQGVYVKNGKRYVK